MSTTVHKGYKITHNGDGALCVTDTRYPTACVLYRATSRDRARKWVDAYIRGEAWANDLAVGQARHFADAH